VRKNASEQVAEEVKSKQRREIYSVHPQSKRARTNSTKRKQNKHVVLLNSLKQKMSSQGLLKAASESSEKSSFVEDP
jgi:membrane protein involved in colicin uptake